MSAPPEVEVFTDGACRGNPGPGGWAALLRHGTREKLLSGRESDTTNNRMEMLAAIRALAALKRPSAVRLATDSQYLMRGVTEWLPRWKKNGWMTSGKEPVKNRDLWEQLERELARHAVSWEWVRGHAGHPENDRVDEAARAAIDRAGEEH